MVTRRDPGVRLLHATRMWRESLRHACHHFERRQSTAVDIGLRLCSQYGMRFLAGVEEAMALYWEDRHSPSDNHQMR